MDGRQTFSKPREGETMVIRLRTNIPALNGYYNLQSITNEYAQTFERLTSGLRINNAADDPSGLARANRFKTQIKAVQAAADNAQGAISLVQTAESGLTDINALLQDIRVLALASSNGTNTSLDRADMQVEVAQYLSEINRIASGTTFNTIKLLNGNLTASLSFQVGASNRDSIRFGMSDSRVNALGISGITVATAAGASAALIQVDQAMSMIYTRQATTGAVGNRLNYAINLLSDQELYFDDARSVIEDADIVQEVIRNSQLAVLSQTSAAYLAQANLFPGTVINLLVLQGKG